MSKVRSRMDATTKRQKMALHQWWRSDGREGGKPTPEKVAAALGGFGRWILIGGVSGGEGEGARCRDYVQLQTKPNQTAPPK